MSSPVFAVGMNSWDWLVERPAVGVLVWIVIYRLLVRAYSAPAYTVLVLDSVPRMKRAWFWFVQVPVWIVEGFWLLYRLILGTLAILTLVVSLIAMVLWYGFGIRWGG